MDDLRMTSIDLLSDIRAAIEVGRLAQRNENFEGAIASYKNAIKLIEAIRSNSQHGDLDSAPDVAAYDFMANYGCAVMTEYLANGDKAQLRRAFHYYQQLIDSPYADRQEVALSCARTGLLSDESLVHGELIKRFCEMAAGGKLSSHAHLLLGKVFETYDKDYDSAKSCYLKAFREGLPWGLRFYSTLCFRHGNRLVGVLGSILATAVGPVFAIFKGFQAPYAPTLQPTPVSLER
ncbi:MAG: hypothetical protein R3F22_04305 [Lysobacteraceae bacterium]